jgi:hypothetical protein
MTVSLQELEVALTNSCAGKTLKPVTEFNPDQPTTPESFANLKGGYEK